MRYFRYKNTNRNINNAIKEQYKTLTVDEKHAFHKEKRWRKFSTIVSHIIYISCIVVGIFLLKLIPLPSAWFLEVLVIVGKVIAGFILLIVGGVLTVVLTMPLWKKAESFRLPSMKKEIISKACGHLRDYYELQEPYIITKCFDATDKKFKNHDVCIFVVGDELRITTDIIRGFLHGERDLGCYALKRDEITLLKRQEENHLIAELKANNIVFLLGYRAKGFIEKNFCARISDPQDDPMFPMELDGAEVLLYTPQGNYGSINYPNGDIADHYCYLAICKYSEDNRYYLFCCNENYEVVSDWMDSSIEKCMKVAALSYKENIIWKKAHS